MARKRLTFDDVVRAGAELVDEVGYRELTMGLLAERLGIRTPSLYKHVDGLADLQRRIAVLAVSELGDEIRDRMQGKAGRDALAALAEAFRFYATAHPGRYTATISTDFAGPEDELFRASSRVVGSVEAMLSSYDLEPGQLDHAMRTIRCTLHGFATLQASRAFRWSGDPEESFDWMIRFLDEGLRRMK
ncbi:WHG domain-containing protein [Amycolatopsis cynarae]|uniref:WHG domain-containing protein n=1 Tax=Amycolatopsis cynarae TaxID=2995223 RepID=A0ABY7AW92_9PSEU|nr:TetR/AcrR family transcriptional regulator [Amycolatopsis sp. HUAS 11-8]WAL62971.1 WHG domain-containing protein [Amycolatopsis sp. HUAS 11-8]